MGPTKADPPRRGPPRLLRFWRFCPLGRPWLLDPFWLFWLLWLFWAFWPGFWEPKFRLRRRDLRLRGFCGWFNPSFIRIPVSFDLSAGLPNVVTRCAQNPQGLAGSQSAKFRKVFVIAALVLTVSLRGMSHRNGRLLKTP